MAKQRKAAQEKSKGQSISLEMAGGPLARLQRQIKTRNPSETVNAAVRTCLKALRKKQLRLEDFHLSHLE